MKQSYERRTRSRIGQTLATAAVALLCVTALSQPNPAYAESHGGGGGFHGGGGGGFHGGGGGGFHGGGGGGFHGGGAGFHGGGGLGAGGAAFHGGGGFHGGGAGFHSGIGFRPGGEAFHGGREFRGREFHRFDRDGFSGGGFYEVYPSAGYSEYDQHSQAWYYCADPAGYYPYVTQCYSDWQSVPAN